MADQNIFSVNVREAKHSDYDAVMKMASPDTFRDGFDYLPAKFYQYVDDPDVYMLVAETDGKVVGVSVYFVTDDGTNLLIKTYRLSPEQHGKGQRKKIHDEIVQTMRHLHPRLQHREEGLGMGDAKRSYLWSHVKQMDICFIDVMYFHCTSDAVLDRLKPGDVLPSVLPYQPHDMVRLSRQEFSEQILTEQLIFVDWDMFQLSASNLNRFSERGVHILVDTCKPAAQSLSFGGSYMTPRGRVYHVDVHCKDVALCQAHIKYHVVRACQEYGGMITFCVMLIDPVLKGSSEMFCVEELGLVHLPHDHTYVAFKYSLPSLSDLKKSHL